MCDFFSRELHDKKTEIIVIVCDFFPRTFPRTNVAYVDVSLSVVTEGCCTGFIKLSVQKTEIIVIVCDFFPRTFPRIDVM